MRTNSINVGCSSISPTIIGLLREHWTTKWDSTAEKSEDIFPQIDAEERRGILKLETNFGPHIKLTNYCLSSPDKFIYDLKHILCARQIVSLLNM